MPAEVRVVPVLVLIFPLAAGGRAAGGENDLETVKGRIRDSLLPGEAGSSAARAALERGRRHAASMGPDGTWKDIDYRDRTPSSWKPARHLARMLQMAVACCMPGGEAGLKPKTLAALDHWLARDYRSGNWWWNEIGVPRTLYKVLLLLEPDLSAAQKRKGFEILGRAKGGGSGQNLVWKRDIMIALGCLEGNARRAADAFRTVAGEVSLKKGAIQADLSYHFHGPLLYSGGYGLAFASDASRITALAHGTRFAFSENEIDLLSHFILGGQQWMMRGRTFGYTAVGRNIARRGITGAAMRAACENMAKLETPRRAEFLAYAERIGKGGPTDENFLSGNRWFWRSGLMCHHRRGYHVSVRRASGRLKATETGMNGENLKGHLLGLGDSWLYRTGEEYRDLFPVWDWGRVPGVSAGVKVDEKTRSVGGASDGMYGLFASNLGGEARKAWLFFDREYACLATGLAPASDRKPARTSINQCHLRGAVVTSQGARPKGTHALQGPAWVHHDGVGYVFPGGTRATLRNDAQSGSWNEINRQYPAEKLALDVFSLWIDHTDAAESRSFHYLVVPGIEAQDMPAYAKAPPVEVLANSAALQAARHRGLKMVQAAFYAPGALEADGAPAIRVDQACLLLVRELEGGKVRVAASGPRGGKPLAVSVGGREVRLDLPSGSEAGRSVVKDL